MIESSKVIKEFSNREIVCRSLYKIICSFWGIIIVMSTNFYSSILVTIASRATRLIIVIILFSKALFGNDITFLKTHSLEFSVDPIV